MNDNGITNKYLEEVVRVVANTEMVDIAKALLSEREKVQDVWKDAPEGATRCEASYWFMPTNSSTIFPWHKTGDKVFTRTLPKTRAREIAEKAAIEAGICDNPMAKKYAAEIIEAAILKYAEGEKNV